MQRTTAILLNWNGGDTTLAALDALFVAPPFETIVVDNGSTDGSDFRIKERFPEVRLLRNASNQGFARAVNQAIAAATDPDFVWLVNSDCLVQPDTLEKLVTEATGDSRVGIVGAVLVEADDPSAIQVWGGGRVNLTTGIGHHRQGPTERLDYIVGACTLVRMAMLKEIGNLDEQFFFYWEDADFSFRARDRGWLLAVAETTRVPHIEADSLGRWSAARAEHLFRGTFTFMRLWAPHPFLATAIRLTHHSLSAVRRQRWGWLVGAWRGVFARTPVNQTDRGVGADSGAGKSGRR